MGVLSEGRRYSKYTPLSSLPQPSPPTLSNGLNIQY